MSGILVIEMVYKFMLYWGLLLKQYHDALVNIETCFAKLEQRIFHKSMHSIKQHEAKRLSENSSNEPQNAKRESSLESWISWTQFLAGKYFIHMIVDIMGIFGVGASIGINMEFEINPNIFYYYCVALSSEIVFGLLVSILIDYCVANEVKQHFKPVSYTKTWVDIGEHQLLLFVLILFSMMVTLLFNVNMELPS